MQCRRCGTEIADKALICYRCGAATTDPVYQPPAPAGRESSAAGTLATLVTLVLLVGIALYMGRAAAGETPRYVTWAGVAAALVVVIVRAVARRRR